ncbi:MAG: DUF58 domain-containing protein [Firmicutes bacterium]|nr:DUF58 domain-containing protein [Bacillota bacterium]
MTENKQSNLVNSAFLKKLETLRLLSRKIIKGSIKGERRSMKKGRSVEFADYRDYVFGDEIRTIDWNVYGRLDRLFVKLFVEEEELILYLMIDKSLSMGFGNPEKLDIARKIAASLSYIALSDFDRVSFAIIDEALARYNAPIRGKQQIFRVFEILDGIKPSGKTSLNNSIMNFISRKVKPGMVVVISDFLDEEDFFRSLKFLTLQKHDVFLIQVLDDFELNPGIGGDVKLVDMETGESKDVTVTDRLLEMYLEAVNNHCKKIHDFSHSIGAGYILAPTGVPFEDLVLDYLRKGALIK